MKILLLDMDDVLVQPGGYHKALQETVRLVGGALGFHDICLSEEDILAFEAAGVYSEWDTSAICAALLLDKAWEADPVLTLPQTLSMPSASLLHLPSANFQAFAGWMRQRDQPGLRPLERAERILLDGADHRNTLQIEQIRQILHTARSAEGSLTHCIFQELVLGSQEFARAYHLPAILNTDSYLLRYDRPLINSSTSARLLQWLALPDHQAVIFTSRPSQPLPGVFSVPEAELGAKLVGLEGLPILGLGGLLWLSTQRKVGPQAFVKPSPVHALAAMLLCTEYSLQDCLSAAASLVLDQLSSSSVITLQGAQVDVVEDSTAGMQSAIQARDLLAAAGIMIRLRSYGVTAEPQKASVLRDLGAEVYPNLNEALKHILQLNHGGDGGRKEGAKNS